MQSNQVEIDDLQQFFRSGQTDLLPHQGVSGSVELNLDFVEIHSREIVLTAELKYFLQEQL